MKPKPRAVVDTNLFVSGIFARNSLAARLQDLWISQEFELVTSLEILKETARVLRYPKITQRFRPKEETIRRFFRLVCRKAVITKDAYETDRLTADPTDNKFLACALEGRADYIISADSHLRALKHFHGIQIVDAATFIMKLTEKPTGT